MYKTISGKEISLSVKERVAEEVKELKKNGIPLEDGILTIEEMVSALCQ